MTTGSDPATRIVWRLQATIGHGWLRSFHGGPIVTADVREAHQFDAEREAVEVLASMPRDRVPMVAVEGPSTPWYMRGD